VVQPGLLKNADGSMGVYFGAKALDVKKTNRVSTNASCSLEVLFRLYGPEKDSSTRNGYSQTSRS
jgi:hypothetical protein